MKDKRNKRQEFADDLEAYMEGKLTAEYIRSVWDRDDEISLQMLPNIDHFLSDEDIRMKDNHYRLMQNKSAKKLIAGLRSGMSIDLLSEITFLS